MGLTPLEGIVIGTRSGDIEPTIVEFICVKEGLTVQEIEMLLNRQSGLMGISGLTNDMRELVAEAVENQDRRALLAIEIFCYRLAKYIGAYLAAMNDTDAIVFAGGISENSPYIRQLIFERLEWLGVHLHEENNENYSLSNYMKFRLIIRKSKKGISQVEESSIAFTNAKGS